jgi:hypothetical protein
MWGSSIVKSSRTDKNEAICVGGWARSDVDLIDNFRTADHDDGEKDVSRGAGPLRESSSKMTSLTGRPGSSSASQEIWAWILVNLGMHVGSMCNPLHGLDSLTVASSGCPFRNRTNASSHAIKQTSCSILNVQPASIHEYSPKNLNDSDRKLGRHRSASPINANLESSKMNVSMEGPDTSKRWTRAARSGE